MAFSASIRTQVRKRAHFSCCLCFAHDVEIHHIIPSEEGGPDSAENAAPLCPSCHETFGGNPKKRKLIREARDSWFEICEARFRPASDSHHELLQVLQRVEAKVTRLRTSGPSVHTSTAKSASTWCSVHVLMAAMLAHDYRSVCPEDVAFSSVHSLLDVLLLPRFWPDSELRLYRRQFRSAFGTLLGARVLLQALHEQGLSLGRGLGRRQFFRLLGHFQIMVMCLLLDPSFEPPYSVEFRLDSDRTLHYRLLPPGPSGAQPANKALEPTATAPSVSTNK